MGTQTVEVGIEREARGISPVVCAAMRQLTIDTLNKSLPGVPDPRRLALADPDVVVESVGCPVINAYRSVIGYVCT